MSDTGRNNEDQQQDERDVESNDQETLSDLAPTSEVSINMVRFPPPSHSRMDPYFWRVLLTGSAFTIVGAVGNCVRNFQHPTGWSITFSSASVAGVCLIGWSLHRAFFHRLFNNPFNPQTGETRDSEARRYREILNQHLGPRVELPSSLGTTSETTESFPPSPAVSNVSSDVLAVERSDYRAQSTDLAFRQKQEERAEKYQKFVKKEWKSAPSVMQSPGKDKKEDDDEEENERDDSDKEDDDKKEV